MMNFSFSRPPLLLLLFFSFSWPLTFLLSHTKRNVSINVSSSHLSNGENSATRVWRFRGTRVYVFSFSLAMHARAQSVCLCFFLFSRFIQNLCFACVFSQKNSFRWCSFTAYIYEGIERGCALYCEGYVNPRGYEQKQFVRYGSGFVPIRYDVNPGYLAHGWCVQ